MFLITVSPLSTNIQYNDKLVIMTVWMEWNIGSIWDGLFEVLKKIVFSTPRNICCGYLLESPRWGNSNKYPQHMFLGVIKKKKGPLLPMLGFFIAANSFEQQSLRKKNTCYITRVLCRKGLSWILGSLGGSYSK